MREHGLLEPVFAEIGHTFRVTFHGPGDRILDLIPEEGVIDLRTLGLNERQIEAPRLIVNDWRDKGLASDRAVRYTGFLKVKMLLMEVSDVN